MTIKKAEWIDDYSVSINEIDNQHKRLFDMLNILIEHKDLSIHSKIITDTLTNMLHYTEYHFSTEEKYMVKYEYPEYKLHKEEHRQFIRKTSELSFRAMENDETVPIEILKFLGDWLVDHILLSDLKLKPFFINNNIKEL